MINKIYDKTIEFIKEMKLQLIILVIISLCAFVQVPYYINGTGGLEKLSDKIIIDNSYKSKGSFNLAYVSSYKPSVIMYLISLINPDMDAVKIEDYLPENDTSDTLDYRMQVGLTEAIDNAILVGYEKASKNVIIKKEDIYVVYILKEANTNLEVGDKILKVNNIEINSREELNRLVAQQELNQRFEIEVENNKKTYTRYAYKKEIEGLEIIGISLSIDYDYVVEPKITTKFKKSESGASGGLMTTLEIYNQLTEEDITKGYKIAGTGTIDIDGVVGPIDGVKYKLKGAVNNKADIFLVPKDNYEEAIKEQQEHKYKIKIVSIDTFDQALLYLQELDNKMN